MQYNQPLCCANYPNCGHVYAAYNCNTGPQWLPNPCMPTPFCVPPCPEVVGDGEVVTVVLPDGTTQQYFLPRTKWCKPQLFNPPWGNTFQNTNFGIWSIRSFTNTQTLPFPYCNSNTTCFPTSRGPVCCSLPYPALCDRAFHNDGWTSTTDLRYFCPGIRCTVCNVFPSKSCSVQTSLVCCDRRVENKSCEKKPSYCNATCSYDSVFLYPQANCNATNKQPSRMSIEECEQKNEKCRKKKQPCSRDSDKSIKSKETLEETCSDNDDGNKTKRKNNNCRKESKECCPKPTKNKKTSETSCCCSRTLKNQKKRESCSGATKHQKNVVKSDDTSDSEDLCSSCRQAQRSQYDDLCPACRRELESEHDDLCPECRRELKSEYYDLCPTCRREHRDSNKNWNLQCNEPFVSDYCNPTRGGDCAAQKDTINMTPSQCSNSTIESIKAETWMPRTDRGQDAACWGACACGPARAAPRGDECTRP